MYKKLALAVVTTGMIGFLNPQSIFADTPRTFQMPSGNIYCGVVEGKTEMLRCEIRSFLNPLPPKPKRGFLECDWGAGLLLPASGKAEVLCISDTIAEQKYTLSYDRTWKNAGFKCVSRKAGLTCTNTTGNGFFLSRERWRVF